MLMHLSIQHEQTSDVHLSPGKGEEASQHLINTDRYSFTGSTGCAVILSDSAHLFTDGRYYIQAEKQLDRNWTLHKVPIQNNWDDWLVEIAQNHGSALAVGLDPTLLSYCTYFPNASASTNNAFSSAEAAKLIERLRPAHGSLVYPSRNLVDVVWADSRPEASKAPVHRHPVKYAGKRAQDKLLDLAHWISNGGDDRQHRIPKGSAFILNQLDQIAWILNLRGASIPCNREYIVAFCTWN